MNYNYNYNEYLLSLMNNQKDVDNSISLLILEEYFDKGLLKRQKHPDLDLYIWNYSEKVQFNKKWDKITKKCRGLVTDFEGNTVARSFSKFFNLGEINESYVNFKSNPLKDSFRVYEKLDGSMGMLFYYDKRWIFCSRGSFTSEQAVRGKQILDTKLDYMILDKKGVYIFEIIYPENRIVVDYNFVDVILLAVFDTENERHDIFQKIKDDVVINVVKEYDCKDPYLLRNENVEGREGYVIVFENGERLKIKFDNYLKLHKQVSNLTVKNAFDWIKSKESHEKILELIPDEYHQWYCNIIDKIKAEYSKITICCLDEYKYNPNKREFALNIKKHPYKALLFKIYDETTKIDVTVYDVDMLTEPYSTIIYTYIEKSDFFTNLKTEDLSSQMRDSYLNKRHSHFLNNILNNSDEKILTQYPLVNCKKQPCYIFDIDGTLALNTSGRSSYNMSRVLEDTPVQSVIETLQMIQKSNFAIIICTGRSDDASEKTIQWLEKYNLHYDKIYFRPYKNREPDYLVKERMWRHINETYNIVALYDDRDQVVKHGRKLGMAVFQVAYGNF